MHSQAFNEVRRLRRDRYGQITRANRSNLTRRTLYPSSLEQNHGSSDNNNIPRRRHHHHYLSKSSSDSNSHNETNESLTNSLMEANYLEMKTLGIIPSIRKGLGHYYRYSNTEFKTERQYQPKESTLKEGDYEDDDDNYEEECSCIPGRDKYSKQRREFWRQRFRDVYLLLFIFMFVAAISVYVSRDRYGEQEMVQVITNIDINGKGDSDSDYGNYQGGMDVSKSTTSNILEYIKPLQDLTKPYNASIETPFFLDIPLTGSSVVKLSMSKCQSLTLGCELGLQQPNYNEDKLSTFVSTRRGYNATYVNVDTSTKAGLKRASKLDLLSHNMIDVISISSLYDSSIIFDSEQEYPARMFAIFAHPMDRSIAYYHYIKKATWDERYDPVIQRMTLSQFAMSKHIENNPMVRLLTQKPGVDPFRILDNADLEIAKEVVARKCLVGLYSDLGGSLARFDRYFGWSASNKTQTIEGLNISSNSNTSNQEETAASVKKCQSDLAAKGDWWLTKQKSKLEEGSLDKTLIEKANELDLQLYKHIELIYEAQGEKIFHVV